MTDKNPYQLADLDYKELKGLLGRPPEALETVLALALWNEHCSYASSRRHLKKFKFPTKKNISGLGEQAGLADLGLGEKVCFKMESHNHPSFITPYQGAATGVGGILRDIFAMGARPIALANYLCFGAPESEGASARLDGVIRGIGDYGNCMGIPTISGRTEFSPAYNKNILVNAMALGYLGSKAKAMSAKAKGPGNYVVYAGSSTGRDGILGADMASRSFGGDQKDIRPTVQIGDPFFGKQLMEASLLAMEKGFITACQDMGAAGLACSSFEMADKGGLGLSLHLDKVPLRDKSLGPAEILLSESQERMLFICRPSHWESLRAIFKDFELEICRLGELLDQKEIELFWKGQRVLKTDPKFWASHSPIKNRAYVFPEPAKRVSPKHFFSLFGPQKPALPKNKKISGGAKGGAKKLLLEVLSCPNGRSRKFVYSQYDQRVGTNSLKGASYPIAVLRLPESGRELGIALGGGPYIMARDVEQGAKDAVFRPALQLALRGFQPWAVTDCLNFGNPEKKEIMGEFVLSVEMIAKACAVLDTPVVSGNVSFYNESEGKNITPSPAIGMIGLKESARPLPPAAFQKAGERVYLLSSHQFCFPISFCASGAGEGRLKSESAGETEGLKISAEDGIHSLYAGAGESAKNNGYKAGKQTKAQERIAYGALQDPLVKLFAGQLKELSEAVCFSAAFLSGKFGIAYSLARMVLEKGIGFSLEDSFPFDLGQERLYEAIVSVPAGLAEDFEAQASRLALNWLFIGETNSSREINLFGEKLSSTELRQAFFKPWEGELSL